MYLISRVRVWYHTLTFSQKWQKVLIISFSPSCFAHFATGTNWNDCYYDDNSHRDKNLQVFAPGSLCLRRPFSHRYLVRVDPFGFSLRNNSMPFRAHRYHLHRFDSWNKKTMTYSGVFSRRAPIGSRKSNFLTFLYKSIDEVIKS